jgi:hypothetical protein
VLQSATWNLSCGVQQWPKKPVIREQHNNNNNNNNNQPIINYLFKRADSTATGANYRVKNNNNNNNNN